MLAAAAQFHRFAAVDGARSLLGLLPPRRDGDGSHGRHSGRARSSALREAGVDIPKLAAEPAWKSFSPRYSATASSTPTCTPATSWSPRFRAIHRARLRHHGHADRSRQALPGAKLPRLLPPRLQGAWRERTSNPAGCRPIPASTNSRPRSARCASRCSTAR